MIVPFGEYRPDVSDYQSNFSQTVLNVVPRGDGYGPFRAFSTYTAAMSAVCRGFFVSRKTDGSISIFAGTSTKLYQLDNTALTWTDVSKGLTTYSALSSTDNWQFAQFGNYIIAVQANVAPQVFDLTSSTEFADLGGSPPNARYVSVVGRFLVLSGLLSTPYRVQWSGLNAVTTWTSGTNSSDYQDLPDGGIVRGVAGGEYGLIFQDTVIRRMTYVPGSPLIFQIERIAEDHGLYAPYSLVRTGERVFYISPHGFEAISAGGYPQQIGKEKVNRTFFADLDRGNLQLLLGAADPASNRVFWAYKSNSGLSGLFDKMICYDFILERFTQLSVSGEYLSSLSQPGLTLEGLDSISGSLDALTFSLDDVATSVTPEIGCMDNTHKLGFFRGDNLEATLETGEQGADGKRIFVRGIRPVTDADNSYCALSKRENLQDTESWSTESQVNAQGFCPQRVSTRYSRGRLRVPAATTWTFASGIEPDVTMEGSR